ncbi:MAG: hypothetical protein ACPLRU_08695 [Desulfofundulus sp.]|uniref:hypothetical protein n=1 Tax=Desulfofundulus sp. TaxID=2282750 RepID=UPI003C78BF37
MTVIFIAKLRQKVLFCLRILVVLAILAVLWGHIYSFIKSGGSFNQPRFFFPDSVIYNPTIGPIDAGQGTFMDRLFEFLRDYYRGHHGKPD